MYGAQPLSYAQAKAKVRDINGVHPIFNDMCIKGCEAYVGSFAKFSRRLKWSERRYDQHVLQSTGKKVSRSAVRHPSSGPAGAAHRSADSAEDMCYKFQSSTLELSVVTYISSPPTTTSLPMVSRLFSATSSSCRDSLRLIYRVQRYVCEQEMSLSKGLLPAALAYL